MNEWLQLIEQSMKRCREMEVRARKERKVWEELQKQLANAKERPFAIISIIEKLRNLQSP
ncbi:MAG: hypothetical protein NZ805_00565 [Armatimonadetes bacterium]|nr:hypothetical protein [Armatimonadota bacterium]MDW8027712.1 hypothetical protein [Armatimonadota bacterium]